MGKSFNLALLINPQAVEREQQAEQVRKHTHCISLWVPQRQKAQRGRNSDPYPEKKQTTPTPQSFVELHSLTRNPICSFRIWASQLSFRHRANTCVNRVMHSTWPVTIPSNNSRSSLAETLETGWTALTSRATIIQQAKRQFSQSYNPVKLSGDSLFWPLLS